MDPRDPEILPPAPPRRPVYLFPVSDQGPIAAEEPFVRIPGGEWGVRWREDSPGLVAVGAACSIRVASGKAVQMCMS